MAKMCDETFECQEAKKTRINSQHKFPYIAVKLIKYSVNHFVSSLFTGSFSLWEHYWKKLLALFSALSIKNILNVAWSMNVE